MSQGYFFKIDNDSLYSEGQIVFRYLPVHRDKNKSDGHHYYPIYVALKPFAIDFYYHGPDKDDSKKHVHVCFLHLPLSLNLSVKDNLTYQLRRMFYGTFDHLPGDDYCFALPDKDLSYWNLPVFSGDKGGIEIERTIDEQRQKLILRKILLDFIFDLEHSQVFEASPSYEEIEVHLRENFFFNAIAAKAAYYYNRCMYVNNVLNYNMQDLYAHNLIDSEIQWLNIIRDERAADLFSHEDWFRPVEEEYKKVIFDKEFDRSEWRAMACENHDHDSQNVRISRESARWFLRRYNLWNCWKTILHFNRQRKSWMVLALISFIVAPFLLILYQSAVQQSSIKLAAIGCLWLLSFSGLVYLFRKMAMPILGATLPRLLMAISSAWLLFTSTEELWKSSFDTQLFDRPLILILLLPVVLFVAIEIKNMAPEIKLKYLFYRIFSILSIGFIYSILIGILFIGLTGDTILVRSGYLAEFYMNMEQREFKVLPNTVKATAVGLLDSKDDFFGSVDKKAIEQLRADLLKFEISTNTATLTKLAYLQQERLITSKIDSSTFVSLKQAIERASDEIAFANLKHITYDINFLGLYTLKMHLMYEFLERIPIFPGMLYYRSIFALFIGIFIQLIFEDKPMTEPL